MAAHEHLNAEQLRMFIPAKELKTYNPNPYDYEALAEEHRFGDWEEHEPGEQIEPFTMEHFWEQKSEEAGGSGVWHSVGFEGGVYRPVNVYHGEGPTDIYSGRPMKYADEDLPTLAHGHHRVAAAEEHDPEMLIPVRHYSERTQGGFHSAVYHQQ